MPGSPRSRAWCLTLNNWTTEEYQTLLRLAEASDQPALFSYLILGKEEGEEGTPHLQGYAEFSTRRTLNSLRRSTGFSRIHWEVRRGTQLQAVDYCKKDGDFIELGVLSSQGQRTDLLSLKSAIDSGRSLASIADDADSFARVLQYRRGLEWYSMSKIPKRSWKSQVWLFRGPTGTGKTKRVWDECKADGQEPFVWPGGDWFDGYKGQEIVLFDDFCGELRFRLLLRLLDRYPMQVPIKGGHVEWCPKKIYITSNLTPEEWYAFENDIAPLRRRIENDIEIT